MPDLADPDAERVVTPRLAASSMYGMASSSNFAIMLPGAAFRDVLHIFSDTSGMPPSTDGSCRFPAVHEASRMAAGIRSLFMYFIF